VRTADEAEEPVVVLEEETDPEKIIEERRRKREEIMAKFRANGRKASVSASSPATQVGDLHGTGADSVTSAGINTGIHTGALSSTGEWIVERFALRGSIRC
jgi:serine/threonine-protein kinase PRP4